MVQILAHRGSHRDHPENTLPAFRTALDDEGADGVELDVRTCASGEVVVVHDPDLKRVAGRGLVVAREPWRVLREVDVAGARLPLLDEVLDLVVGAGRVLNIEVKGDVPHRRRTARAIARLLKRRSRSEQGSIFLSTFDPIVLAALQWRVPQVPSYLLFDAEHTGLVRAFIIARTLRPRGINPHHVLCTPARLARWKRRGYTVNAWTVNDPAQARRLAARGLDAVITDDVPALVAALRP